MIIFETLPKNDVAVQTDGKTDGRSAWRKIPTDDLQRTRRLGKV